MKIKLHIPAVSWGLLILIIIGTPGKYVPQPHGFWELISPDKIVHLLMFGPFSYLMARGIYAQSKDLKLAVWRSLIFGIVYAIFTELLQFYVVQGRNGNIYDAIADSVGVGLGLYIFYKKQKSKV